MTPTDKYATGCPHCGCELIEIDQEDKQFVCPRCGRIRDDLMHLLEASGKPFPCGL